MMYQNLTKKSVLVKFTKKMIKKKDEKSYHQSWLVNANRFASKRYCYTVLFPVKFTGKSGNVY